MVGKKNQLLVRIYTPEVKFNELLNLIEIDLGGCIRGIYSYQKLIFFPNQVKLKVDFFSPFSLERWVGALAQPPEAVRRRRKFFEDRLGYPAISMNFKTELYIYVVLLIKMFL